MISKVRGAIRLPLVGLASGMGSWILAASSVVAQDGPATYLVPNPGISTGATCVNGPNCPNCGGHPAGVQNPSGPGFQGFGLGFHLGYGYGGRALGTTPNGGYPFYGGPGYPHPWPCLNRFGPITPFPYYGGPGGPVPGHPNFFTGVGPLVPDQPVVTILGDTRDPSQERGYGPFTGALPYPESAFAPFATMAGESGSYPARPIGATPGAIPLNSATPASATLGMEVQPFTEVPGIIGLKINAITPGGVAEKAGLHVGDVILTMNGYVTQKWFDLRWILENATSDHTLNMKVRTASDGKDHAIVGHLP